MRSPAQLAQVFREKQLKLTPQRQLLFGLLHENDTHPTAEGLFEVASKQMPGISLRTVYQTLGELVEMGELQSVDVGAGVTNTRVAPSPPRAACRPCATMPTRPGR